MNRFGGYKLLNPVGSAILMNHFAAASGSPRYSQRTNLFFAYTRAKARNAIAEIKIARTVQNKVRFLSPKKLFFFFASPLPGPGRIKE